MNSEQWRVEIAGVRLPALLKAQHNVDDLHCRLMTAERDLKWAEARCLLTALTEDALTGSNQQIRDAQLLQRAESDSAYRDTQAACDSVRQELAEAKRALTKEDHLLRLGHELLRLETAHSEAQRA